MALRTPLRHGREHHTHEPHAFEFVPGAREAERLTMAAWQGAATIAAGAAEDGAAEAVCGTLPMFAYAAEY